MGLPTEVILLILESLEKRDLKSARLVSKTWTSLAAELLFDQVYVSVHPENLEVFKAITRHPLLSQCIKTLRYDAVEFAEDCTKKRYLRSLRLQTRYLFVEHNREELRASTFGRDIKTWVEFVTTDDPDDDAYRKPFEDYDFVNDGYQKYQKCAALQRALFNNGTFLESLVEGLQTLKNLSCVMIDGQWGFPREDLHDIKLILKKPTGSPLARDWNLLHMSPQGWDFVPPHDVDEEEIFGRAIRADHYWTIIAALLRTQRRIQTFNMGDRYNYGFPPFVFDRTRKESPSFYGLDVVAFSEVQVLKLVIARYGVATTPELFPNIDGLRSLLRSMHRLRILGLYLPESIFEMSAFYKSSQIFPQEGQWNQLTSLSLSAISSSAADFLTLITRKMPALSHLELGRIRLDVGDWEGVIECMEHSMHLSRLDIEHSSQFYHRGATEFLNHQVHGQGHGPRPDEIKKYVESGGRHPCLRPDQSDSTARLYITTDIQDFYQPIPTHPLLLS